MRGGFETHGWASLQIATAGGRGSAHLTAATSNPRASLALRKTPQSRVFLPDRGGRHDANATNIGNSPRTEAGRQRNQLALSRAQPSAWTAQACRSRPPRPQAFPRGLAPPGRHPSAAPARVRPFEGVGKSRPSARMKTAYPPARALPYLCPECPLCLCLASLRPRLPRRWQTRHRP
jgi:hypothetical protein